MRGALSFFVSALLLLALLGMGAFMIQRRDGVLDLSSTQRNTLAPQTIRILESVDRPVRILAFFKDVPAERALFQDLVQLYQRHCDRLSLEFVDLDRQPELARAHGVTVNRSVVLISGELQVKTVAPDEAGLSGALVRVLEERPPQVAFLSGYGGASMGDASPSGIAQLALSLQQQNFAVIETSLAGMQRIPIEFDCVVLAAPENGFTARDADLVTDYLLRGGRLLCMVEPLGSAVVDSLLEPWGLRALDGIVFDPTPERENIAGEGSELIALALGGDRDHVITRSFGAATLYPIARGLEAVQPPAPGLTPTRLVQTAPGTWLETDFENPESFDADEDRAGPIGLAFAVDVDLKRFRYDQRDLDVGLSASLLDLHAEIVDMRDSTRVDSVRVGDVELRREQGERARLVVFGDVDFVNNANLLVRGNSELLLSSLLWLTEHENRIALPPRPTRADPVVLTRRQKRWLRIVGMGVGPGIFFALSIGVVFQRRRWL